jgi:hypothetical protein
MKYQLIFAAIFIQLIGTASAAQVTDEDLTLVSTAVPAITAKLPERAPVVVFAGNEDFAQKLASRTRWCVLPKAALSSCSKDVEAITPSCPSPNSTRISIGQIARRNGDASVMIWMTIPSTGTRGSDEGYGYSVRLERVGPSWKVVGVDLDLIT